MNSKKNWIAGQISSRVIRRMIQIKAKELFEEQNACTTKKVEFSASNGWLMSFMKRYHLNLRKRTALIQTTPANVLDKVISYLLFVEGLRRNCGYRDRESMLQTMQIDPIHGNAVEKAGAKTVSVLSTGGYKSKVTVLLAAMADGKNCHLDCSQGERMSLGAQELFACQHHHH